MNYKKLEKGNPKVSVGILVYNGGNYLRKAIDSILTQTYNDYEIIISDNASSDDTQMICEEYASLHNSIRYIRHLENQGLIFNYQYTLSQAKGDYFMWASHDDTFDPNYILECLGVFEENPDCISVSTYFKIIDLKAKKVTERQTPSSRSSKSNFSRTIISLVDIHPNMIYGLHKTEEIRKITIQNFDWFDVYMIIQLSYLGKIIVIPRFLYDVGTNGPRKPYSLTGKYISFKIFRKKMLLFTKNKFSKLQRLTIIAYVYYITFKGKNRMKKIIQNWQ